MITLKSFERMTTVNILGYLYPEILYPYNVCYILSEIFEVSSRRTHTNRIWKCF